MDVPQTICLMTVPQGAKTGANEHWSPTTQAHLLQNAAEFGGKVPLRSEGSPGSEAWMRSGLCSRARMHACTGPGLHPTGGPRIKLRRTLKNCALREKPSAKSAYLLFFFFTDFDFPADSSCTLSGGDISAAVKADTGFL
jgi:hypothetical protein